MREVQEIESIVGIHGHSLDKKRINASFRQTPDDFQVEEIPSSIKRTDKGRYTYVRVRLKNRDTNRFLMDLASSLHIPVWKISDAGTKDKFAVTAQYFCLDGEYHDLPVLDNVEYLEKFCSENPLRLGDLMGNTFTIRLSSDYDITDSVGDILTEIDRNGGFPNFFGLQRFGSMRPITHIVGKYIVRGDFESAVREYIADPAVDHEEYRLDFLRHNDPERSLREFPPGLVFERMLLKHLADGGRFENSMDIFPRNLSTLFVHAYQSYIFNTALSRRMEMTESMDSVMQGDQIVPVDRYFNAQGDKTFSCDAFNIRKISKLSSDGAVRPVIKIPGFRTEIGDSPMDSILRDIMEKEGIKTSDFRIQGKKYLSSSGSFRIVSAKPIDLSFPGKNVLRFSLGKGIYATSLLREIVV